MKVRSRISPAKFHSAAARTAAAALVAAVLCAAPALPGASQEAPDGGFSMPLNCTLDRDCWIINLPDAGQDDRALDHRCGSRTYNRHEGTDFAVRDFLAVDEGADVIASAGGVVTAARDGTPEHFLHDEKSSRLVGAKACGNAVIVQHEGGWESLYCHLRKDSISVALGDRVKRGDKLGQVGMSGRTQFPHVHVEFRRGGKTINPFTGGPIEEGCRKPERPLWQAAADIRYPEFALYAAGFTDHVPTAQRIWSSARSPVSMARHAPALVLWAAMFGVRSGDVLKLRIVDPDGAALAVREVRMNLAQARTMTSVGRNLQPDGWKPGRWLGEATLERFVDGRTLSRKIAVPLIVK